MGLSKTGYNRFLLVVAGLGGLLYGVDVGIIAGALPYLEATSGFSAGQLSFVVAAVLLGSVFSTLLAGVLADWLGRKTLMSLGGLLFVVSIPMIALARGYQPLVLGRLLQGISAGLIGVVVPLYLAECLGASNRGKGTGVFQGLLSLGIVAAAAIGLYFSIRVEQVTSLGDASRLFDFKDRAWRGIFWVSLPPGILFVIGSFMVAESPRWLFRQGRRAAARAALLRSCSDAQTAIEFAEMESSAAAEEAQTAAMGPAVKESLLQRKYVIPFVLACLILACTQLTGVNSVIGYNAAILIQAGLSDKHAHLGYLLLMCVSFAVTAAAILLVDRKGRKFLLSLGTGGVILSLLGTAVLFHTTEKQRVDCSQAVQAMVTPEQKATIDFNQSMADKLLAAANHPGVAFAAKPATLVVIYSCGGYLSASKAVRSDEPPARLEITRESCLPTSQVESFFKNPFADLNTARSAPLKIENALITPVPGSANGWLTFACLACFMAFFSAGPGVCVWLALSELMPTRIRSNGMSIALLINQAVSTTIAAIFLPTVGRYGYSTMFFAFAGCTVVYFIIAAFFLPETKGKTLEEIEAHFTKKNL